MALKDNKRKNHIAFITPKLSLGEGRRVGGGERVAVNLIRSLIDYGLSVDLVLFRTAGADLAQLPPRVQVVDLEVHEKLFSPLNMFFRILPKLVGYLRRERPQALLCFDNHATLAALLARRFSGSASRLVASIHNTLSLRWTSSNMLKRVLSTLLLRFAYTYVDTVVAVSQGVAEDLVRLTSLPWGKIQVIYNPVITPELFEKAQQSTSHPWFKQSETPVILGVGRLTKQKDFPTLIRAFARVRKKHQARLLILGEGEARPHLESLVRDLGLEGEVDLPGFVENPYPYMKKAAVFVLSSAWEGLPTALIEAMALGTPVVATNCPSGPSEILEGGRWGHLVPVGDEEKMAKAILEVLNHPKEPIPMDAWIRFSSKRVTEEYIKVLLQ